MNDKHIKIVNELYATFQDYMSREYISNMIKNIGVADNEFYYEQCYQYVDYKKKQQDAFADYNQKHEQRVKDEKVKREKYKKRQQITIKMLAMIIVLLVAIAVPPMMYFFSNRTPEYIKYTRVLRGYNYIINVDTTSEILKKFVVKMLGTLQEPEKYSLSDTSQPVDEFDLAQTKFGAEVYQMQELDVDKCKDKLSNVIKAYNIKPETKKDIFDALSSAQFQKTNYDVNVQSHHIDVYYIRLFVAKMHENKYSLIYGAIHWAYNTNGEHLSDKQMDQLREKVELEAANEFGKGLSKPQSDDFLVAY